MNKELEKTIDELGGQLEKELDTLDLEILRLEHGRHRAWRRIIEASMSVLVVSFVGGVYGLDLDYMGAVVASALCGGASLFVGVVVADRLALRGVERRLKTNLLHLKELYSHLSRLEDRGGLDSETERSVLEMLSSADKVVGRVRRFPRRFHGSVLSVTGW